MNDFINKIIEDDFLWNAIMQALPTRRRQSGTRFVNINCPVCVSRGETADKRGRCGIKYNAPGVGISCFNCGFKTRWRPGELLSRQMQEFLGALGLAEREVKQINLRALAYRSMFAASPDALALVPQGFTPSFSDVALPPGAESFARLADRGCCDPDFIDAIEYLYGRGDELAGSTTYYWTPDTKHHMNRRVIIPFTFEGRTVGWTARAIDKPSLGPRYQSEVPANYLFNNRVLTMRQRKYVILVEGVLDALAIDGLGLLGANLNQQQIAWINGSGLTPILLPDRDSMGAKTIDLAIQHGWRVAFPALSENHAQNNWWKSDIKDAADATKKYGRIWALTSIIESSTNNKIEIGVKRKILY